MSVYDNIELIDGFTQLKIGQNWIFNNTCM